MIIGVSGKKQVGKDTVSDMIRYFTTYEKPTYKDYMLWEEGKTNNRTLKNIVFYEKKSFAHKLKKFVADLIGCTVKQLEDEEFKNTELGEDWIRYAYATGSETVDGNMLMCSTTCTKERYEEERIANWQTAYEHKHTPRTLLQMIGTNVGRLVHRDFHVLGLMNDYKEDSNWIITDVRFPNEVKAIEDRDGVIIRVNRHTSSTGDSVVNKQTRTHPSETALDNHEFEHIIDNNNCIESLYDNVYIKLKELNLINNKK